MSLSRTGSARLPQCLMFMSVDGRCRCHVGNTLRTADRIRVYRRTLTRLAFPWPVAVRTSSPGARAPREGVPLGPVPAALRPAATYVACAEDRAVDPAVQYHLAQRCRTTEVWQTSHSPFLSRPDLIFHLLSQPVARSDAPVD